MLRRLLTIALCCVAAQTARASDVVRIAEIGVKGYYFDATPTLVRVFVLHSDPSPASVTLQIDVRSAQNAPDRRLGTFTKRVSLNANDNRFVDVPILFQDSYRAYIDVQELDGRGHVLAEDSQALGPPATGYLTGILCDQPETCQQVQSQILFSGSSQEQTEKNRNFRFVDVQNAAPESWEYSPLSILIVARSVSDLSPSQQQALENFARQGGALIVPPEPGFLAAYRTAAPSTPESIGRGVVLFIPSLASGALGQLFSGPELSGVVDSWRANTSSSLLFEARNRLAPSFHFPGIAWLMAWLAAYILLAGICNFAVLRKLDRRELGWITLPCISIVFACAMYFSSALKRPGQSNVQDVAVRWMDENSPVAFVQRGDRILSNRAQRVQLKMDQNAILEGDRNHTGAAVFDLFSEGGNNRLPPWQVQLDPLVVDFSMLQWSFRDLEFSGVAIQPGTIHRIDATHFRNETGSNFREAVYLDKTSAYSLGTVATGADIDLSSAIRSPRIADDYRVFILNGAADRSGPPTLGPLMLAWPLSAPQTFDGRSGVFMGLSDEQQVPASLASGSFSAKGYAITIVSFEPKP